MSANLVVVTRGGSTARRQIKVFLLLFIQKKKSFPFVQAEGRA